MAAAVSLTSGTWKTPPRAPVVSTPAEHVLVLVAPGDDAAVIGGPSPTQLAVTHERFLAPARVEENVVPHGCRS